MNIQLGITDHLDPEVEAMLMAMYSRSYAPIASRIPSSAESTLEHKEKLGKYYRDWGHKSVGQLGSTTIWLEGVSQLAAKAIENHPLFNGQESSTRYIDFSTQPFANSGCESFVECWAEKFRAFYIKAMPIVVEDIRLTSPLENQPAGISEKTYENTIRARAFDILRGFLPAGATTNVVFTGTFDTINDHFGEMLFHPLLEMRTLAVEVLEQLSTKYSHAAVPMERLEKQNKYLVDSPQHFYQTPGELTLGNCRLLGADTGESYRRANVRKPYQKLPKSPPRFRYVDCIDFGSYRDLHRHRNGTINMPPLCPAYGFNAYYLNQLPKTLRVEARELLGDFERAYDRELELTTAQLGDYSYHKLQYAVPMGFNVKFEYTCDLNQVLYILELRSKKTVHQTLRDVTHRWYKSLLKIYPNIGVGVDLDPDNFTLKRGTQTFATDQ